MLLPLLSFLPLVLASPLQLPFLPGQPPLPPSASLSSLALQHATPVRVQLGVMSRCPDAHLCEAVWERVLETRTTVANGNRTVGILARELIQLETVYIGRCVLPSRSLCVSPRLTLLRPFFSSFFLDVHV